MSGPAPGRPGRPGLQPERTALAWQRTAVVTLLLTVALGWHAAAEGRPVELVLAAVSAFWAAAAAAVMVPRSAAGPPWARLVGVVGATVVLALAGTVTALVSAGANHP